MPGQKRLILCLHDVTPKHFDRVREIDAFYREIGAGARYAMLVVPNFDGEWPLQDHPEFLAWLKERADAGVEMFLHGFYHHDTRPKAARPLADRAMQALAGEGEFLALGREEALRRLREGRAIVEAALGRRISAFVAPAWHYSDGAIEALAELGFDLAENRMSVWSPHERNRVLTKSPVIAYASRDPLRVATSVLWSRIASVVMNGCGVVRHALHPDDFNEPRIVEEIRRSLTGFIARRTLVRYRDLLDASARDPAATMVL